MMDYQKAESTSWPCLLSASISDSAWTIYYSQQFFSSTSGSKLFLNVPEWHGNQRWLVAAPVNLLAFIHQAWQML